MASFRLLHFSSPTILRAIDRQRLLAFLQPYQEFLDRRQTSLPSSDSSEELDYEALVGVFMSPQDDTPKELIDALYCVDGMATSRGMDDLLDAAKEAGLVLDTRKDCSPADVAVQVWLKCPELLERKQAEQHLFTPRSFEYFQTNQEPPLPFRLPDEVTIRELESALNVWFEGRNRGPTARVYIFEREDMVWFLVRHGEPFKREESVEGTEPTSVTYRPLKYDVLVYVPAQGEIRINAQSKGEKQLYRREFGRHFFGRDDYFPDGMKYTLAPLRECGSDCLTCVDIEQMEWVRLKELHYDWGGPHGECEIAKASDLFAALEERGRRVIPRTPRLARAVFLVKFRDAKRPRSVTIKPPNVATYMRDGDSDLVEEWLTKRGFLNVCGDADDSAFDPLLASA